MISLKIEGKPRGKGRPRVTHRGTYTDNATREYEARVKSLFKAQYPNYVPYEVEKPLEAKIQAFYPQPKSFSKVKRDMATKLKLRPTIKPDVDNIIKIILDSLNGLAYHDDNQVVRVVIDKYYDVPEGTGKVFVEIREAEND